MSTSVPARIIIREANKGDCGSIMKLIKDLSEFENLSDQVLIDSKNLEENGFGDRPWFKCVVAECTDTNELVGYALFYYVYSTFQGRCAYLEDLYISPSHRQQGLATQLIEKVAQIILAEGCIRLDFIALKWNTQAIKFYEKLGAIDLSAKEDWHVWRLEKKQLESLTSNVP